MVHKNMRIDMDIPKGAVVLTVPKRIYIELKFITKYDRIFVANNVGSHIHIQGLSGMECDYDFPQIVNIVNKKKYDT